MTRQLLSIAALLLGSGCLFVAGGINGLILPLRGQAEGFSDFSLGLLGTGWALGYVLGCVYGPVLVARVGHIRSFSVMAAFAGVAVLASLLIVSPFAWVPLRALSGFCFASAAMIVEGWLGERSDAMSRGRIFGFYTMINLVATTLGQVAVGFGPVANHFFFVVSAMFYALALVPTAVTSTASPKPLVQSRFDLRALWINSPIAVVTAVLIGVSNGSFGTLSAVYAARTGLSVAVVALFVSIPILAGAAAQLPAGYASDRMDRRIVLVLVILLALLADAIFLAVQPQSAEAVLVTAGLLGASVYVMYPLIIAHANDHAAPGTYIQTSGGLLFLYGLGAIVGPLLAGLAMGSELGAGGLFVTLAASHIAMVVFALWRIARRGPVPDAEKTHFVVGPTTRSSTPQTSALAVDVEEVQAEEDRWAEI